MIDGHIHYCDALGADRLDEAVRASGLTGLALQCIPKAGRPTEADALAYAAHSAIPVYIFGGIPRDVYRLTGSTLTSALLGGLDRLDALGIPGLKLLEGKPDVRFHHPMPDFDDPVWSPFWARLAAEQRPIVMHLGDPAAFWDETKVTPYAREAGWFYDGRYPTLEGLRRQMRTVLDRHPTLRILFPHMLFMASDLPRLDALLTRYPHVYTDTTPALEQLIALGQHPAESRAFFLKWQHRICYGTDIGSRQLVPDAPLPLNLTESATRVRCVRDLLTRSDDYFILPGGDFVREPSPVPMRGLALPQDVLDSICDRSFREFMGDDEAGG